MSTAFRDTACVAVGGGVGSVLRELLMLGVADLPGGFPMSIFMPQSFIICFGSSSEGLNLVAGAPIRIFMAAICFIIPIWSGFGTTGAGTGSPFPR